MKCSHVRRQLPACSPERRIEIEIEESASGGRQVVLRDLSYGPGIGWFPQKTIRLDAEQADALRQALCCARAPRLEAPAAAAPISLGDLTPHDDAAPHRRSGVIVPLGPRLARR